MKIGFIGQGYVGKNYADDFDSRGYEVVRYSLEQPFITNKDQISTCDVVFIAVPTPSTPDGFDISIVREALSFLKKDTIAVIKSTILPGSTEQLQTEFPDVIILFSPEFLSVATAAWDVANPFCNIIGLPIKTDKHINAAMTLIELLRPSMKSMICSSVEAELIKYSHNVSGYMQILTFNLIYDIAQHYGADWSIIEQGIRSDPYISNKYSNPTHKGGRGAGGLCFIKDMAAFAKHYETVVGNQSGIELLRAAQQMNIELLENSNKDLELLKSVYNRG